MRTFGQLLGEMVHHADEGRVVANSGDVHRLAEVRGQLRVGDSVEELPDSNIDFLTRAEFAAQVGVVLSFFQPTGDGVLIGFEGGLEGLGGELAIHVDKLLRTILRNAELFKKAIRFRLDIWVKSETVRDLVVFIFFRGALCGFLAFVFLLAFGLLIEDGLAFIA